MEKEKKSGIKRNSVFGYLLVILIIVNSVGLMLSVVYVITLESRLASVTTELAIQQKADTLNTADDVLIEYYKEMSEKTDSAIERMLIIVGFIVGFVALFGGFLAYKETHDIHNNMEELRALIKQAEENDKTAQENIREAKYYAEVEGALSEQGNENTSIRNKIRRIDDIIKDYPDLSHAYFVRGNLFRRLGNAGDKKDRTYFDLAVSNYFTAMERGEKQSKCYNNIAIAFSNLQDDKKAIEFYNQAINDDKNNAQLYANRGVSYKRIGEFEKSLEDFKTAKEIDGNYFYTYYGLGKMFYEFILNKKYNGEIEKQKLIFDMLENFEIAKIIDPSHPDIEDWLEAAYELRDKYQSSPADPAESYAEPQTEDETETAEPIMP